MWVNTETKIITEYQSFSFSQKRKRKRKPYCSWLQTLKLLSWTKNPRPPLPIHSSVGHTHSFPKSTGSQSMVPRPAATASPGKLLEIHIIESYPRPVCTKIKLVQCTAVILY